MLIGKVEGFELLDSRGNPTVAARVTLSDGSSGFAISPSGASTGMYEAYELRDGDSTRYAGKGVKKAAENVSNQIAEAIIGLDAFNQLDIDRAIIEADGTENKSNLGANAILAVSLATAKAAANCLNIPLYRYIGGLNAYTMPRPMMNILNGGAHAANNLDIQEFMIIPMNCETFSEGLVQCCDVYRSLGSVLKSKKLSCGVGDEGGFAPEISSDKEALELLVKAIQSAGYDTDTIKIALDAASSEWYNGENYFLPKAKISKQSQELVDYYKELSENFPIISIEDGLADNDIEGWKNLTKTLGNKIQLVGDDLFVTNSDRLIMGINEGIGNSILIKPNQIGTLSETLSVIRLAKNNGYSTVISHRSGETEDTTISDIAVALNAGQIKTGAPCRTDRVAKYNRLLMIENELR